MKNTRFTETQIVNLIKEYEADWNEADIKRKHAISWVALND